MRPMTNSQRATKIIVMMLVTHWMPGLSSCSPIWMSAIVRPTLGKIMAYHTHLKLICFAVCRVEMRAMLKNQKARAQMKLCL